LRCWRGQRPFVDIARFGEKKIDVLRRFRPFRHGTPAHDHLGDILSVLDAAQFQRCFVNWVAAITGAPREVIAIDGKTLRRSGGKKDTQAPIHMVSAFATRQRLVLGQVKVADKSNEIVAISKLLELLAIEGAIITIDAIGCQRDIARHILAKKADYVLALKGNQGSLCADVELFAAEQRAVGFKDAKISRHQTVDGDHGRIETRTYTAFHDVAWLQERHQWPGLQGIVMVESAREIGNKIEGETRFYITSLAWLASQLGPVIRSHWAIGVSSEGHAVMSVKVRPEPKDSGSEARGRCGAKARRRSPPTTYSKGVCAKHQVATCSERRRSLVTWFNRWPRRSITREGSKGRRKESEAAVLTGGVSAAT